VSDPKALHNIFVKVRTIGFQYQRVWSYLSLGPTHLWRTYFILNVRNEIFGEIHSYNSQNGSYYLWSWINVHNRQVSSTTIHSMQVTHFFLLVPNNRRATPQTEKDPESCLRCLPPERNGWVSNSCCLVVLPRINFRYSSRLLWCGLQGICIDIVLIFHWLKGVPLASGHNCK